MNVERILEVANAIENALPENFHMAHWFLGEDEVFATVNGELGQYFDETLSTLSCGTTACIAGWAVAVKENFSKDANIYYHVEAEATEYLGLTREQAQRLFYCDRNSVWYEYQSEYDYSISQNKEGCWEHEFEQDDCEECLYSDMIKDPEDWDISNKDAVSILKRIAIGEIQL